MKNNKQMISYKVTLLTQFKIINTAKLKDLTQIKTKNVQQMMNLIKNVFLIN